MNILENIFSAFGAINSNKLRSALTMLGVIIGVSSVVLMIAIGQGAQRSITNQIQSLGTNLLTISPGSPNQTNVRFGGGGTGGGQATTALRQEDVDAITQFAQGLRGIAPEFRSRMQVIAADQNTSTSIVGTVPDYETVRNTSVSVGSFITDQNIEQLDKVAVLGPQVVTSLFPGIPNPIGQTLSIQQKIFTVIGVLTTKGQQGFANADDIIIIPLSTMQKRVIGQDTVSSISISVEDSSQMATLQQAITAIVLNSRRITDSKKQDFTVLNQADAVQTLNQVTDVFTLLLGGIAAISLLVGGIGVMNIMLVSVTERTREIGIRKAIGAKKSDILLQFLIESTVLSILGGILGTLLSVLGSWIVQSFFNLDASISIFSVLLAFIFSACVGIFFGMLPAYKAATLRPIQALRYE